MGYHTNFEGEFTITPPLKPEHNAYLTAFCETRRMTRNAALTAKRPDPLRAAVGLPVGPEGCFFVGSHPRSMDDGAPDVRNHNEPPSEQPGLWNGWIPSEEGDRLVWDGSEKFYAYTDWLRYMVANFFQPWGYKLNGTVEWNGEEPNDRGRIVVKNNLVKVQRAEIVFRDEEE